MLTPESIEKMNCAVIKGSALATPHSTAINGPRHRPSGNYWLQKKLWVCGLSLWLELHFCIRM